MNSVNFRATGLRPLASGLRLSCFATRLSSSSGGPLRGATRGCVRCLRCVSPCGLRPGVRLSARLVAARASRGPCCPPAPWLGSAEPCRLYRLLRRCRVHRGLLVVGVSHGALSFRARIVCTNERRVTGCAERRGDLVAPSVYGLTVGITGRCLGLGDCEQRRTIMNQIIC